MKLRTLSWGTLSVVVALGLLCCNFAKYLNPIYFPFSFIAGLVFPYVLLVFAVFLVVNALKRKRLFWWLLATLIICWKGVSATFGFHFFYSEEKQASAVKIMTYNVKNFDLYNWTGNAQTRKEIMAFIKEQNPDVINLQEFYTDEIDKPNINYFTDTLGYKYYHFLATDTVVINAKKKNAGKQLFWGVATFSKYPIVKKSSVNFANNNANGCLVADLVINKKTIRLYNAHLQSVHLGYEDYNTIEELTEKQRTHWFRVKNILRKIKVASRLRASQADAIRESIAASPYPVCVVGDFNDVPVSYTYQTIRKNLADAFVKKGSGFGSTFTNKLSFYRIDHTLFSQEIQIYSYKILNTTLSDHYPIIVEFSL